VIALPHFARGEKALGDGAAGLRKPENGEALVCGRGGADVARSRATIAEVAEGLRKVAAKRRRARCDSAPHQI